jgi:nucleoside-diphosphate-sugar epimerase
MSMVVITGCSGFIGSHLTEALLQAGNEVIGIDCLTDYYPTGIKEGNIKGFLGHRNFTFLRKDILDMDLRSIVKDADFVFHLAAQPGVRASWGESFSIYARNNILVTQRLLEACKGSGIKRFVYSSSSSVYGDVKEMPIREDAPTRPVSPYGVTKLAAENLCFLYFKNYGLPAVSLRYFTVYGPRQRPDMAFQLFISSIMNGRPISIFGDGKQTRDFTHVSDVVAANILAMKNGSVGEVYNIGGGSRISMNEAIGMIEEASDRKAHVLYKDVQKGDMRDTYADIRKSSRELGYQPKVSIKSGLTGMVNYATGVLRPD